MITDAGNLFQEVKVRIEAEQIVTECTLEIHTINAHRINSIVLKIASRYNGQLKNIIG